MNSALLIKLLGGLTVTAGIGTGGYILKEHLFKSPEKSKDVGEKNNQDESSTSTQQTNNGSNPSNITPPIPKSGPNGGNTDQVNGGSGSPTPNSASNPPNGEGTRQEGGTEQTPSQ